MHIRAHDGLPCQVIRGDLVLLKHDLGDLLCNVEEIMALLHATARQHRGIEQGLHKWPSASMAGRGRHTSLGMRAPCLVVKHHRMLIGFCIELLKCVVNLLLKQIPVGNCNVDDIPGHGPNHKPAQKYRSNVKPLTCRDKQARAGIQST